MKRLKKSQRQFAVALLIGIIIISAGFGTAYILTVKQIQSKYQAAAAKLENEISSNKRMLYKSAKEIKAGDVIKEADLKLEETFYGMDLSEFISVEDIGKRTLIDIGPDQPLLKNMLEPDLEQGLRELEYYLFQFNSNIVENDLVDIRLRFPNGEDYIVLPKKLLKNVDLSTNQCNLWLNEEELLQLSSAIVDASQYTSAYLYTARYLDSGQLESIATYQPNESIMLLIANDPNIVTEAAETLNLRARKELEKRLESSLSKPSDTMEQPLEETDPEGVVDTGYPASEEEEAVYNE